MRYGYIKPKNDMENKYLILLLIITLSWIVLLCHLMIIINEAIQETLVQEQKTILYDRILENIIKESKSKHFLETNQGKG